ncbi:MAG: hypothetical protein ORN27_00185, partial [Rhodoluna sp.]|nr:hypothetical protein [Rhodoluna sp.]
MNRIKAIIASAILVGAALAPVTAATAAPTFAVPKTSFKTCDETWVTFCVESVSIQSLGMAQPEPLKFAKSGVALGTVTAPAAPAAPTADPTASPQPLSTITAVAGAAVAGRWATETWSADGRNALGYDGLFVDVKSANAFTNHLFFDVRPVKVDPTSNATTQANQPDNSKYAVGLSPDDIITIK